MCRDFTPPLFEIRNKSKGFLRGGVLVLGFRVTAPSAIA